MEYIKDFLLMLQLLTRIPVKKSFPCEMKNFRDGSAFFAVIGLIIGLLQYGVYSLLSLLFSLKISVVFTLVFTVIITGGFHIDGLGDTCDGFFAFKGKERVIEIMKDSRIGTFACIAIVFDILIKYVLISESANINPAAFFILPPLIGRGSMSFMAFIGRKAKEKGSGNLFIKNTGLVQLAFNLIIVVLVSAFIVGMKCLILLPGALILTVMFNSLCNKKMGGITGDSFGADNEIVEMLTLLILCAGYK